MKKFSMLFLAAAVALVGSIVAPKQAEAVPAFARQVGVSCYSCHYQHFPKLNAFGREFKLGGFTQSAQDLIQDEHLSIPPVLNAAILLKYRYVQNAVKNSSGTKIGKERGELQIYDEGALLIGGRVGEGMGALVEFGAGVLSSKFIFSKNFGGVQGGLVAYQTDGLGHGYGMELFNTGAQRNQRGFENRNAVYAASVVGTDAWDAATGINLFAGSDLFLVTAGLYGPANATGGVDTGFSLSTYIRAALTPKVADGLDLMVGVQMASGKTTVGNGNAAAPATVDVKTESTVIDFQAQTAVGGMPLEVVAAIASTGTNNHNNPDSNAMNLGAELELSKGLGVKANYLNVGKMNGATVKATSLTVGGWLALAQNAELVLEYSMWSGDDRTNDNEMLLMLEFAF